ncbi:CdaR family protein [Robertmurraya korlensis]|jgi:YbbR domain-containing protein|uniref:CdaR family protein n=1 Tax=Robertmurraya korlensis TaxID=519977 RepID=UPI000824D6E2|nr:CdaR family protein [Robertmurraya korlensis]
MDNLIDKLIDNRWFIRVVALLLAFLLFVYVYDGEDLAINVPQETETETITDVPVKSYYDTENLVVSGIPSTVTIKLSGPKNLLQQAKTSRSFEVYVDLSEAEIGKQRVPIEIKDVSDRLTVEIEPDYADVSLQEKVTQEFKVEPEYNASLVSDGYTAEQAVVKPNKVKITGAKDVIEKITYVKATIDLEGKVEDTVTKEAKILVLDQELNKLDVILETDTVEVTIPVKASSKEVPIKIVEKGTPPDGVTIESINLGLTEATILAKADILAKTESVRVEVDVSSITDDTTLTLPVIISEGIVKVDPQTVDVIINVSRAEDITFSNIPIKANGLAADLTVSYKEPVDGTVSITATGDTSIVGSLKESDFDVILNLAGLGEGEHSVDLNVTGPKNINWTINQQTAKISITKREA